MIRDYLIVIFLGIVPPFAIMAFIFAAGNHNNRPPGEAEPRDLNAHGCDVKRKRFSRETMGFS